ncbi:MAG TPA: hypothetical protein VGV62_06585, partial [Xanthobacteraceae bacterium]|nr:hypothetical protein [Xanthobacteraceae bacterium]
MSSSPHFPAKLPIRSNAVHDINCGHSAVAALSGDSKRADLEETKPAVLVAEVKFARRLVSEIAGFKLLDEGGDILLN